VQKDDEKLHLHQRFALQDYESLVENFQKSDEQYGQCMKHGKRIFEFYCFDCSEPLCAMCIIDNKSEGAKHSEHEIAELQAAYQTSLKILKSKNQEHDNKKRLLRDQMGYLVEQMKRLKSNSDDIEERLYQLLAETLALLSKNFEDKSGLLKNDFAELQRQENEI
jgi:B-box zinc finger